MNIRPFEVGLIVVFVLLGFIGLFALSHYAGDDSEQKIYGENVTLWGTIDPNVMFLVLSEASQIDPALNVVKYQSFDARTFDSDLTNAIAEGNPPDLVILPHTSLVTHRSKLLPISFETLPERTFRDTYIDGAEIFMRTDGVYGIPLMVDPLVLYWNRDIFSSAGIAIPPETWEELVAVTTPAIVRVKDNRDVSQSAIALGEFRNVTHAKEILSMLLLQAGSKLIEEKNGQYVVTFNTSVESGVPPAEAALAFYTQFSNPTRATYSWNRTLPLDVNAFTNGTLAMYIGNASEVQTLQNRNPNIDFDMVSIPQGSNTTVHRNYGTFYAFAIPRASANRSNAYKTALALASDTNAARIAEALNVAPALRSLYTSDTSTSKYADIIKQSALISRGWLDPSPRETGEIFREIIEEVSTGRANVNSVVSDAVYKLESLLR